MHLTKACISTKVLNEPHFTYRRWIRSDGAGREGMESIQMPKD